MPSFTIGKLTAILDFESNLTGLKKFESAVDRTVARVEARVNKYRANLNKAATASFKIGAVGAAGLAVIGKAGLDTDSSLRRVRAELGLTVAEMEELREEALRVGSALPLNTADIVNAQRAYGKLGATYQEIIRDIPAISGAAVATDLDPESIARYAKIAQNIWGGDVNDILDSMLKAANNSAASFQELGESFQFSGQSAKDTGQDLNAYLSTLGGIAGAGRSVESVGQGLTAMWGRLAKSQEGIGRGGAVVTKAFEGVGISMKDVNARMDGTAEGFISLLELIHDADLSTRQLTALLSTLAGDSYAASLSFAVQNPEEIRELLGEVENAGGEVDRQIEIILEGASGAIIELKAMWDTLRNRLAESGVTDGIEKVARALSGLIGWLTKTDAEGNLVHGSILKMISGFFTLLTAMLAVGVVLKLVSFALGGFVLLLKGTGALVGFARLLTAVRTGLVATQAPS